ncbi:MAG: hypothetical protein K0R84_7 [Clostridia bacterium]|jgi:hypothetical protein|nr:hypothetical protein [Clostridia bacterium]
MTKEITGALKEWQFARLNTIEFIKSIGNEGLREELPRLGLDTFCKHFQEMINVQQAYVDAIRTGVMSFENVQENDAFDGNASVEELINEMETLDSELEQLIADTDYSFEIIWDEGERKTISNHLCALSTHEIFHIGQLVGFCYACGFNLPEAIIEFWGLSPQE